MGVQAEKDLLNHPKGDFFIYIFINPKKRFNVFIK